MRRITWRLCFAAVRAGLRDSVDGRHAACDTGIGRRSAEQSRRPREPGRRRRQRQPETPGPRCRHPGQAGERQQGDRRRADRTGQRRRGAARSRRQRSSASRRPTPRSRTRRSDSTRSPPRPMSTDRPTRYLTATDPADIVNTAAAGQTLSLVRAAGGRQPAAGPHRAGEQGVRRAAGQAERRPGRRGRRGQPADRGIGADRRAADVQGPAGRAGPADRRAVRGPGQARRGAQLVGAGSRPPAAQPAAAQPAAAPAGNASADWDRAPTGRRPRHRELGDAVGSDAAGHSQRLRQRRPDRDHQRHARDRADLGAGTQEMGRNFLQKLGILPTPTAASPTARSRACTAGRPPSTSSGAACRRWVCRTPGAAATPPAPATASTPARAQWDSTARG